MDLKNTPLPFVAKTFAGLENVLAEELTQLGAKDVRTVKRAVEFSGDLELLYKANLWCRTAINFMQLIKSFEVKEQQDLYDGLRKIKWEQYFDQSKTIAVKAVIFDTVFDNSHFVELRSKDAVVDHFSEKFGSRPNVDTRDPDIKISIHLSKNICKVSLDSSGAQLFKRNYRRSGGEAPLNEVLAAGLIKLSGWDKKSPLIDPMCGSGTIPIEASFMAQNIPAGTLRKSFGFQNWNGYDAKLFEQIKNEAKSKQKPLDKIIIEGHDISGRNIGIARQNTMQAGLLGTIHLQRNDFFSHNPVHKSGTLIINPPYGKRIKKDDMIDFFKKIGDTLKTKYDGYSAWIISEDSFPLKFIGLKPSSKISVYNGPIECSYMKFEVYKGSKKWEEGKKHVRRG